MRQVGSAFAWLTGGVFLALLLPGLARDGMFMDGQLYSAVAHNQANGYGTFWLPRFSEVGVAGMPTFHEHPPLFFGMQAVWFKVFGSAFWVERAYNLVIALGIAVLLGLLWRAWVPGEQGMRTVWLPLLLWIIVPTVFWSFHNNMIENTMAVFTTAAVLLVVRGADRWWPWYPAAVACVVLAVLCKGLPGAFPLAAPVLVALTMRTVGLSRALLHTLGMTVLAVGAFLALWAWPDARADLEPYVEKRLLHRIAAMPTVEYRWATLEMMFSNMLGPIALCGLAWGLGRRHQASEAYPTRRPALTMLLIGLSGVLPLMLTLVQKSFYLTAALPLVSMALALWSLPFVEGLLARASAHPRVVELVRWTGIVAVVGAIVASAVLFGSPARDAELLRDVHRIGAVVPAHSRVGVPAAMWNEWNLQTYLMRYHFISLDSSEEPLDWYITRPDERPPVAASYRAMDLGLEELVLWRRVALGEAHDLGT